MAITCTKTFTVACSYLDYTPSTQVLDWYDGVNHPNDTLANFQAVDPTTVTFIYIYALANKITSYTCLDPYVNLASFWMDQQNITTLTVSGFNLLADINFNDNLLLTDVTISNLPALTALQFQDCTALDTITVTNCPNITDIYLTNGSLLSFDPSPYADLVTMYLYDNDITTIDISNNPLLETLGLSGNPLSALDITVNPLISFLTADNCGLIEATVNAVLIALDAAGLSSPPLPSCYASFLGTNAAPTGAGLAAKTNMVVTKGWVIDSN